MPIIHTDAILWYNVGVFGEEGFAIPNPSDNVGTLNQTIWDLVDGVGRALQLMLFSEDVDMEGAPSFNTVFEVHRLYQRVARVLRGRAVPPNEPLLQTTHSGIGGAIFKVYPAPYHRLKNAAMKRWAALVFTALSDMMQHSENRRALEITTAFVGDVGPLFRRVYENMAMEYFGKSREEVASEDFALTDADFAAYDPSKWQTRAELLARPPQFSRRFTEDQVATLRAGIAVTDLPADIGPWPYNVIDFHGEATGGAAATAGGLPRTRSV